MLRIFALVSFFIVTYPAWSQDSCFSKTIYDPAIDGMNSQMRNKHVEEYISSFIGCKVPSFVAQTLDGKSIKLEDFDKKIVLLNFWFTHCRPCVCEMPALNKLVEYFKGKNVVFISFAWDSTKVLDSFLVSHPLKYQLVPSALKVANDYRISPYPTNMILTADHHVAAIFHGGCKDPKDNLENFDKIKPVIEKLLSEMKE